MTSSAPLTPHACGWTPSPRSACTRLTSDTEPNTGICRCLATEGRAFLCTEAIYSADPTDIVVDASASLKAVVCTYKVASNRLDWSRSYRIRFLRDDQEGAAARVATREVAAPVGHGAASNVPVAPAYGVDQMPAAPMFAR